MRKRRHKAVSGSVCGGVKRNWGWLLPVAAMGLAAAPAGSGVERDALLEEVRALRRDLHAVAVVAQRIQLVVYRVHVQAEVARRAKQSSVMAASGERGVQFQMDRMAEAVRKLGESIRSEPARERRAELEARLEATKAHWSANSEALQVAAETARVAQREYETERARLDELEARLDQLERQLEGLYAAQQR